MKTDKSYIKLNRRTIMDKFLRNRTIGTFPFSSCEILKFRIGRMCEVQQISA